MDSTLAKQTSQSGLRTDFLGVLSHQERISKNGPESPIHFGFLQMEPLQDSSSMSFDQSSIGLFPSFLSMAEDALSSHKDSMDVEEEEDEEIRRESTNQINKMARTRRRHFSLEDYSNDTWEEHSNDSSHLMGEDLKLHTSFIPEDAVSIDTASDYICAQVLAELETKLWNTLQLTDEKVSLPHGLLTVIAKHILQEGSQEPCGLKGCKLNIYFEGFSDIHFLGTLICDPGTVPTFQLTLTLRQSPKSWGNLLSRRSSITNVSTSYKLVKKCLYRDHSPATLGME